MDTSDIVSSTVANLFNISDINIGNFQLAQLTDYFSFTGEGLGTLKLIMAGLSLVFAVLLIALIVKLNRLTPKKISIVNVFAPPRPASSGVNARWEEITRHINSTREAEWKFAVIEADKIVDETLKNAGFAGETLGERLMNIDRSQLETLESLWTAHKIRNRLAHDMNYFLRYAEAKRAVDMYEKTLRELQAL